VQECVDARGTNVSSARRTLNNFDWQFAPIRKLLMEEPESPFGKGTSGSEHAHQRVIVNGGSFVLVSQWSVNQVGLVDLAVFIPGLDHRRPIVVVECDGHQFHERTPEQASKDRRRVRALQRLGIPVYPFTGTDVVRSSEESVQEIIEFIDARVSGMERRWFQDRNIDPDESRANGVSFAAPYPWPRTRIDHSFG